MTCLFAQIIKTEWMASFFEWAQGFLLIKTKAWKRRVSAIPILKSEAVTCNFPNRLVIVGGSLSCQKKVLVEEAWFVSFKLHSSTSYHEQCGLALGGLFCEKNNKTKCTTLYWKGKKKRQHREHLLPSDFGFYNINTNMLLVALEFFPLKKNPKLIEHMLWMLLLPCTGWQSRVWTWNSLEGSDSKNSPRASWPDTAFPFHTSVALSR